MAPIDLCDQIDIQFIPDVEPEVFVTSDSEDAPSGPGNLIYRAAELVRRRSGRRFSLVAGLQKRIPVGSGMGGGSSDAAAVLVYLNRQLGTPFGNPELRSIGSELGADVPFFVVGRPAIVSGIGETVEPLKQAAVIDLVVCCPSARLSTAEVFAEADRSLTSTRSDSNIADFVDGRRPITELLVNDLEAPAVRMCPEVRILKLRLLELGALGASMTGSGSAVFGVCADGLSAQRIAAELRQHGWWACATRSLTCSPAVAS
jgi:4-diphosphocytidyl-2-C-methyl-D-erythritol kinase